MRRVVAVLAAVVVVAVVFGARPADEATADPVRLASLRRVAAVQAATADAALAEAEQLLDQGLLDAGRGQAAVLSGDEDPAAIIDQAAGRLEGAAGPIRDAQTALADLAWTLRVLDPDATPPSLAPGPEDVAGLGAQWRATGLPLAAEADLRRAAEATLTALGVALAALDDDDPEAALGAIAQAEVALDEVRGSGGEVTTLPFWIDTVEALLAAATDIAEAAQAGDAGALARARAAYEVAAEDAARADQALAIALGEAASAITGPASTTSAAVLREVAATRAALAALSILP